MARDSTPDRLVTFTDAVVAIAMTLLVLPLAEVPPSGRRLPAVLSDDLYTFGALALSFFVVARLWWAHHRTFQVVERLSIRVVVADVVWLFTVVLIPAATALLPRSYGNGDWDGRLASAVYLATLTASGIALTVLSSSIHLDPVVSPERGAESRRRLVNAAVTAVVFAIALAIGATVPYAGESGLVLLFVTGPVERRIDRRLGRRDLSAPAA